VSVCGDLHGVARQIFGIRGNCRGLDLADYGFGDCLHGLRSPVGIGAKKLGLPCALRPLLQHRSRVENRHAAFLERLEPCGIRGVLQRHRSIRSFGIEAVRFDTRFHWNGNHQEADASRGELPFKFHDGGKGIW
jgi:hypothetical protein